MLCLPGKSLPLNRVENQAGGEDGEWGSSDPARAGVQSFNPRPTITRLHVSRIANRLALVGEFDTLASLNCTFLRRVASERLLLVRRPPFVDLSAEIRPRKQSAIGLPRGKLAAEHRRRKRVAGNSRIPRSYISRNLELHIPRLPCQVCFRRPAVVAPMKRGRTLFPS